MKTQESKTKIILGGTVLFVVCFLEICGEFYYGIGEPWNTTRSLDLAVEIFGPYTRLVIFSAGGIYSLYLLFVGTNKKNNQ